MSHPMPITPLVDSREHLRTALRHLNRERAEIVFEPLGPLQWRVKARVEQELNMDMVRPMDLSYAEWESAPDNPEAALVLIQRIRTWIAPQLELRSRSGPPAPGGG